MKKILMFMLVLIMTLALVACGGTGDESDIPSDDDHVHVFEEAIEVEPTCVATGKKVMKCACGEIESEEELPLADHNVGVADCENDAVCSACGTVFTEKYGHDMMESVVLDPTCSADGVLRGRCQLCGVSVDTPIPADPSKHVYDYAFVDAKFVSACTVCGVAAEIVEKNTIIKFDFDSAEELSAYPKFKPDSKNNITYSDGYAQMNGAGYFENSPSFITSAKKILLSFDFQIVNEGNTEKGESIFSFVPTFSGKKSYYWTIKYFETSGVVATVEKDSEVNDTNSFAVNRGEWYNCSAILDTVTQETKVYINGVYIGTRTIKSDFNEASKFGFRFCESTCLSNPMFDNFKLVEID